MKDDDDDDEKYLPYSCGKLREKSSKIPEREIGKLPTSLQSFQTKNGFFSSSSFFKYFSGFEICRIDVDSLNKGV